MYEYKILSVNAKENVHEDSYEMKIFEELITVTDDNGIVYEEEWDNHSVALRSSVDGKQRWWNNCEKWGNKIDRRGTWLKNWKQDKNRLMKAHYNITSLFVSYQAILADSYVISAIVSGLQDKTKAVTTLWIAG